LFLYWLRFLYHHRLLNYLLLLVNWICWLLFIVVFGFFYRGLLLIRKLRCFRWSLFVIILITIIVSSLLCWFRRGLSIRILLSRWLLFSLLFWLLLVVIFVISGRLWFNDFRCLRYSFYDSCLFYRNWGLLCLLGFFLVVILSFLLSLYRLRILLLIYRLTLLFRLLNRGLCYRLLSRCLLSRFFFIIIFFAILV